MKSVRSLAEATLAVAAPPPPPPPPPPPSAPQPIPHPRTRSWRQRGDTGLRILSAIPIGYAVASLWAMALARILPGDRAEATVIGTLAAFAICAGAAMWAFAARSGWRALWTLVLAGGIAATITALSIQATGRL